MPPKPQDIPEPSDLGIPDGYMRGMGTDGESYLVTQQLIPDLHQSFVSYRKRDELGVLSARAGFRDFDLDLETEVVGNGLVVYPANPVLSDQERLLVHAEILALQERLGISYKDASHRLYMAEIEKLKAVDKHCKALANLKACLEDSVRELTSRETPDSERKECNSME